MSTDTMDDLTEQDSPDTDNAETLATAELEVLREENERLRAQFKQARQTTYRRTALAFLVVGGVALGGAGLFPDVRVLLVALGGTGVFAAILTSFITPEEFLAASVSEHLFAATAANGQALVDELGLQNRRVYVPVGEQTVRLYLPAHREYAVPPVEALRSVFVVTGDERERGVTLQPTGSELYTDFERAASEATDLEAFAAQLGDAVVEQFELARGVSSGVSPDAGQARFDITGQSCGDLQALDHPVVSFLGTGLAIWTDQPVRIEFPEEGAATLIQCHWAAPEDG